MPLPGLHRQKSSDTEMEVPTQQLQVQHKPLVRRPRPSSRRGYHPRSARVRRMRSIHRRRLLESFTGELAELVGERAAILNQGEPPGCHADDCRDWLPRQHVTMVTRNFFLDSFWLPWQCCCHDYQVSLPFFALAYQGQCLLPEVVARQYRWY